MDITEQLTHESRIALAAAAEITRLRARLEVRDDGGPDGILCRDESIRMQDAEIARLRAEVDALRADAERYRWLRDGSNPPWVMQMLERYADNGSDFDAEVDAARAPQQAEPVAWMAFGGSIVHAVTRNAMDPIEAERFDVPLYLHPPADEVQRLRDAARDVCEWADAAQWALGNETGVPAAKLDALRKALEGGE